MKQQPYGQGIEGRARASRGEIIEMRNRWEQEIIFPSFELRQENDQTLEQRRVTGGCTLGRNDETSGR